MKITVTSTPSEGERIPVKVFKAMGTYYDWDPQEEHETNQMLEDL